MEQALSRHRTAFRARPLTLTALCLAVLVAQVDTAVVNLALHPIGEALSAGVDALQWVVDGYNLVYAALLLTGGLLADLQAFLPGGFHDGQELGRGAVRIGVGALEVEISQGEVEVG